MHDGFHIFANDRTWVVTLDGFIDAELTKAVQDALSRVAYSSERTNVTFCEGFFNHQVTKGEASDAFVSENELDGRQRIESYLASLGFEVVPSDRQDRASWVNPGAGKNHGRLSMHMTTLHLVYDSLHRQNLRSKFLPTHVDNYVDWSWTERRQKLVAIYGKAMAEKINYNGMQFIAADIVQYAIRIEDPTGLPAKMLDAARRDGWSSSAFALLHLICDTGARFSDAAALTALDWWRETMFGNFVQCPLKGSKGRRQGRLEITAKMRDLLIASFDEDPRRPDFRDLKRWAIERNFAELERHFLFPSATMRPFSYHVFHNDYVRPTMKRHDVRITSRCGSVSGIATLHRLRAASIQSCVEKLLDEFKNHEDWKGDDLRLGSEIRRVREDHNLRSEKAFRRYLGEVMQEFARIQQRARSERRNGNIGTDTDFEWCSDRNRLMTEAARRAAAL